MRHHVENRHTVSIIKNAAFTTFLQKKLPLLRNIAALLIVKRLHSVYTHRHKHAKQETETPF